MQTEFSMTRKQMKENAKRKRKRQYEGKTGKQLYLSFSTTLMTEMLKVVNHATRLIMRTPPSAF
jgi:hypothetical protein